ncbi:hypothetical protein E4T66_13610 [Sinimarinibacterium sp. CAU 1509]|uniref:hypothetical protein n=1 Tax=Sinimarinibacterium sp. CAU 1509 TaxID=2562283 RepID=UPI0010AB9C30|nr:hypothetical protein [Sinimarinibacterium sp. CAU 1509]TJY59422.1 hypothetical protein E4T66_13610 [Sinimarinibacterium sp. CAU 1509]
MEHYDFEFAEPDLDNAGNFLEGWLETPPDWRNRYPTLASLLTSSKDDKSTESDDLAITQGLSELKAATIAKDGTLELRAKVLRLLTDRMVRRMHREHAALAQPKHLS